MAKNNNAKYVILGAVGLAAIWLLTRKQTTSVPPPTSPYIAQQQLQQWAQTQPNPNLLQQVISKLTLDDIMDFWDKVFGKGSQDTYSGGGSDTGGYYDGYILV